MLAVLVTVGVLVALLVDLPEAAQLQATVDDAGVWGVLGFVTGYAVLTLTPLPKAVLSTVAGLVFGVAAGTVVVLVGATLGAWAAFEVARWLGQGWGPGVRLLQRWPRAVELLERRGIVAVLVLRLVPVVPFTALNYACGLSPVRRRDYLLGTVAGMLPGTLTYVTLGAYGTRPGSAAFLGAVGVAVVLTAGGLLVARRSGAWRAGV